MKFGTDHRFDTAVFIVMTKRVRSKTMGNNDSIIGKDNAPCDTKRLVPHDKDVINILSTKSRRFLFRRNSRK